MVWNWIRERRERRRRLQARMAHPRNSEGSSSHQLEIGYLIDWIDSRPEEREQNLTALSRLATGRSSREAHMAMAAAVLMGMPSPPDFGALAFDRDLTHDQVYRSGDGVFYHDRVVGQLEEDELEDGAETYRALLRVEPACLSALANLSEDARRHGRDEEAVALARQALALAEHSTGARYGVADSAWQLSLRCLLARLTSTRTDTVIEILHRATDEHARGLLTALREAEDPKQAAVDLHAAFGMADAEARIWLRVIMSSLPVCPPPPLSYGGLAEYRVFLKRRGALWRAMEEELAARSPGPR